MARKISLSPQEELERTNLVQWIEWAGFTQRDFAEAINLGESAVSLMLNGRRPVSDNLKWKFLCEFGPKECRKVFGGPPEKPDGTSAPSKVKRQQSYMREQYPELYDANKAVGRAKAQGLLPKATVYKCHNCDNQAEHYHHASYHQDDRLCVVPLCHSCHVRHHKSGLEIEFGVVPTAVGVIRIAIAGNAEQAGA